MRRPRRPIRSSTRPRIVAFAAAAAVAAATLIGSGPAHADGPVSADGAAPADSLSIAVHPGQVGNPLRSGYLGFSFGAATVANDVVFTSNYAGTVYAFDTQIGRAHV